MLEKETFKERVDEDPGRMADTCYLHFLTLNSSLVNIEINIKLVI